MTKKETKKQEPNGEEKKVIKMQPPVEPKEQPKEQPPVELIDPIEQTGKEMPEEKQESIAGVKEDPRIKPAEFKQYQPSKDMVEMMQQLQQLDASGQLQFLNIMLVPKNVKRKTLGNTSAEKAKQNISDLVFFGDGDTWKLISKASSESEGWMKSTKAMNMANGCVIQTTTQQINPNGTYSITDAVCYCPGNFVEEVKTPDGILNKFRGIMSSK